MYSIRYGNTATFTTSELLRQCDALLLLIDLSATLLCFWSVLLHVLVVISKGNIQLSIRRIETSGSSKQKLNTKSSTETELMGIDDAISQVIWAKNFMEAQGYKIKENVVHQDNKSTILLAKNGRMSSSKRMKHIAARYFFVTD